MADVIDSSPEEPASPGGIQKQIQDLIGNRWVQIGAGVLVAFVIMLIIVGFFIRGAPAKGGAEGSKQAANAHKKYKYVKVFEALTPMDAAQMREALSIAQIPFESEKEGRVVNISIPKEFSDEARIKMAQLGLPEGGIVGFEIFDKAQSFGATEYDKQIQFIRAASGELSRLISKMNGIISAKVQLVIPEQKAFGERLPGSASVMLTLKPKQNIGDRQIKGIMHLVASSVEDIRPEDVTVVDNAGNILSERVKLSLMDKRQSLMFEMLTSRDDEKGSPLETLLRFRDELRKNFEKDYEQKVKQVLATLYPMGSYLVFVHVDLKEAEKENTPYVLNKIDVAILLDINNRDIRLTSQLKASTYSLVASAIGYQQGRDTIVIEKGPFVSIESEQGSKSLQGKKSKVSRKPNEKKSQYGFIFKYMYFFLIITIIFVFIVLRYYHAAEDIESDEDKEETDDDRSAAQLDLAREKFQLFVQNNEERILYAIEMWLKENPA